jgi:DDE family transposase
MSSSVASIALLQKRVAEMLPSLSKAEAMVLGLLSYGILILNGSGITRLSNGLAKIEQVPAGRLRQRLREFYYEAGAKRGNKRREVDVQDCFPDLLRAVLRGWQGKKELALGIDAMTLGERFTVLSISVVYRGCGIPIAWKIIAAMQEGEWRPHWEGLLATLEGVVPSDWKVIVMADRGLYAAWLYRVIQKLGWHPMLRVKEDLSFRTAEEESFSPMGERVKRRGRGWSGKGEWSEHGERMEGTVLIRWEKGYEEKLVVVTDLDEKEANAAWYQMRFWIEDEYKDHKSGGWGWEQTKMTDPKRAERQWLARAVAMQIAVLIGGQEEAEEQERKRRKAKRGSGKRGVGRPPKPVCRPRAREQSVLMAGQQSIQAAVARGEEIPMGHVVTQEWPKQTYAVAKPTKSWVKKCREKEAKKRHHKNKQAHANQAEPRPTQDTAPKCKKMQPSAKPPKSVRKRECVKQEQQAKRSLRQAKREERKREQEEHRVQKQREREERKREQELKRERRLRAREQREQERLQRRAWHEEIKHEREQRLARKLERMARSARAAVAQSPAVSMILADDGALVALPKPP